MKPHFSKSILVVLLLGAGIFSSDVSYAGSIFVSGHDPDFHAVLGGNVTGAEHIIQQSIAFARDGNTAPILFLQSNMNNISLGDHTNSEQGLINSGFTASATPGTHYIKVDAGTFATTNLSSFSAIFVPSDHGGTLTGNDIRALNNRVTDIIAYLNAGGGLVAFAEDGFHQPATPGPEPALYGFLPFLVSSTGLSQGETGFTLSPFGVSLGLTTSDISNNFSHNFFTGTGGMLPVDFDAAGRIVSLGFRGQITPGGVVTAPEPASLLLLVIGLIGIGRYRHLNA